MSKIQIARNASIDRLRLCLAMMVVGQHTQLFSDISSLANYLTVNGLFRIAVPVFFIINGYYFDASSREKFLRWLNRATRLYVTWMLFYAPMWFSDLELNRTALPKLAILWAFGYYHLWYIIAMIGAGVILWFLTQRIRADRRAWPIGILALALFLLGVTIQYAGNYHLLSISSLDRLSNANWAHRNFLFLGFPFFAVGYLIRSHTKNETKSSPRSSVWFGLGMVLLFAESFLNYRMPTSEGGFDNLASLIVACPIVFLVSRQQRTEIRMAALPLAKMSMVIYLLHPYIMIAFQQSLAPGATPLTILVFVTSVVIALPLLRLDERLKLLF
jgi:surface polysaccharide O-acyltransferase-like enzyme